MEQCCRTCLQINVEYLHLFNHFENGKALSEMLTDCGSLKLEQDDGFSFWICLECKGKLISAWAFRTLARESDSKLRGICDETIPMETIQAKADTLAAISDNFYNCDKDTSKNFQGSVILIEGNLAENVKEEDVEVGYSNSLLWDSNYTSEETSTEVEQNISTVIENNSPNHCTEKNPITTLNKEDNLEISQNITTNEDTTVKCEITELLTYDKSEKIERIQKKVRLPKTSTFPKVRCDECKKLFSHTYFHGVHIYVHNSEGRYLCKSCNQRFENHYQLEKHKAVHQNQRHVCEICGESFSTVVSKRAHRRQHKGQCHMCHICNRIFRRKKILDEHLEHHDKNIQKYVCEFCGKTFQSHDSFRSHKNSHITEKNFVCELCNKRYKTAAILKLHKQSHTNLIKFTCEKCGTSVKSAFSLRRHMLTHNNEKTHPCKICGKLFKDPSTIIRHMLTHTGETPFICSKCPYKCRYKQQFDNHAKKHNK